MSAVPPMAVPPVAGPDDRRLVRRALGALRRFDEAGILQAADVHVASRLGALGAVEDEAVLLAAALAVRAPRLGHVCVDLATVAGTAGSEEGEGVPGLSWPEPEAWIAALAASPLVGEGRPLRLEGSLLYLDRLHAEERRVATALLELAAAPAEEVDEELLEAGLDRFFPDEGAGDLPRQAAGLALRRRLAVIAGGPGTGKTTAVAKILALLEEQAESAGARPPLVALAAPTGKAAARLGEAVREEAERLGRLAPEAGGRWAPSTLHRLLGTLPGSSSRFRHDERHPLVQDVVVVDEASMLSLSLMDRLLAALRPGARLVLLGDPHQLASVEAGVVLGDVVAPASRPGSSSPIAGSVVLLSRVHRFGAAIAALASAVRDGDADRALALLESGSEGVSFIPGSPSEATAGDLAPLREEAVGAFGEVRRAAAAGAAEASLAALSAFRVLCAHRRGPAGAVGWSERIERWLGGAGGAGRPGPWFPGQPLLVTRNDYDLGLFNGDTGVVVAEESGRLVAAFDRGGTLARLSPSRLSAVEPCYAMTVHKAQGSQFDSVAVVLPEPGSRVLTRELLYTAITRARRRVIVQGSEESVRAAIGRPIARASGLRGRLETPGGRRCRDAPGAWPPVA